MRPYAVIIGTRTLSNGEAAAAKLNSGVPTSSSEISVVQIDVSSAASIEAAVALITSTHGRIDSLINNAGAAFDLEIQDGKCSIRDGFNTSWDTNVSGTHILTTHVVPLLLESSDPPLLFLTLGTSSIRETLPRTGATCRPSRASTHRRPPGGPSRRR
uniref:Short-chain dehydrogenase/reductase family protein n=1 Tax=Mycena chlorophos TaxID=658473 RepID=A0ABQ0M193_MYCCL|nr:short-chain dehydrogenase/reductase family protein [Mycena chlorophos]